MIQTKLALSLPEVSVKDNMLLKGNKYEVLQTSESGYWVKTCG